MPDKGRQTPTQSFILPYETTSGQEAIDLYEASGRSALEWQKLMEYDIMATNEEGLWTHQKFGFSVPRRNGKNEIVAIRELWGLVNGENICHTAHRTNTSRTAWTRLCKILSDAGYVELGRKKKDEEPTEKGYRVNRQHGLENISLEGGGIIEFRTRTSNGGLGEGFDLLVIDEAQEYTDDQEAALIYTVSDSRNPQTLFCGTPPTTTSSGTVFVKMRGEALAGSAFDTGWAEWSIPDMAKDITDVSLWYETNPSMGAHLDERKIRSEIRGDVLDFNIQRLGVWMRYNLKSAISRSEWEALTVKRLPQMEGKLYIGIKYNKENTNVAMSIAVRTKGGNVFVEAIDCRSVRDGNAWIIDFLSKAKYERVVVDGAGGQEILKGDMKNAGLKLPLLPTTKEVIVANAAFERGLFSKNIRHKNQPSLAQAVSNCEKRAIGTNGGFGFKSLKDGIEIALMDSMILAYWPASESRVKKKQRISY